MNTLNSNLYVVGIGASAGGLIAIQELFDNTPDDTGKAFIIIQHLSPDFVSLMPELLAKHTNMKIFTAEDKQTIEPNCIYLNQRNKNLHIKGRELYLLDKGPKNNLNLPIDIFFHTLGEEYKEKSIGVILSGTGSDGSRGLKSIKEGGGFVLVQDPETAQFDGMPNAAIASNQVDLILSTKNIGAIFNKLPENSAEFKNIDSKSKETIVTSILTEVLKISGIDFRVYKKNTLHRRIEKRMGINNIEKLYDYLVFLKSNDSEKTALKEDFLIGVTRFFRDEPAFHRLKNEVIPSICNSKKNTDIIRIWVAGCSTGEEVYSIAMLFDEFIRNESKHLDFKIFATDIDTRAIKIASAGSYHINTIHELNDKYLKNYFVKTSDKIKIIKSLRDKIVFSNHNLFKDPSFIKMDLISCRNLLIYLDSNIQQKIMNKFHFSLNKFGFLFLGSSESLGILSNHYKTIDVKWKIYQNTSKENIESLHRFENNEVSSLTFKSPERLRGVKNYITKAKPESKYHKIISESYGPDLIFINKEFDILFINGRAGERLTHSSGLFQNNILKIVSPKVATLIRNGVRKVEKEKKVVILKEIVNKIDDQIYTFDLTLRKPRKSEHGEIYMLQFSDNLNVDEEALIVRDIPIDEVTKIHTEELENELNATKAELQNVVEKLETSNEELQSSNEELMASNEELQSTNEELQSVNEELYTVNLELQEKNGELLYLNNDVNNLLESTEIGTLFLDSEFRIRKFTPSLQKLFKLEESDIGRPISSFVSNFNENIREQLSTDVKTSIEKLIHIEGEIEDKDGNYFLKRVMPFVTSDNAIDGVVITFVDINQLVSTKEKLKESEEKFKSIFQNAGVGIATVSDDGKPMLMNDEFCKFLGYSEKELQKMSFTEFTYPDDILIDVTSYEQLMKNEISSYKLEKRYIKKDGKIVWGLLTVTTVKNDKGEILHGLGLVKDITDKKETEEQLKEEKRFSEKIAETSTHGIYIYDFEKGKNIFTNKQYTDILGYSEEEISSFTAEEFKALYHPDDLELIIQHREKIVQEKKSSKLEYRFKHKNGDWVWLFSVDTPFEIDENEKVLNFLGSFVDLGEIKAFEQQLEHKIRELNKAQEISKVGSWYLDVATNNVSWTKELYKMYGFDASKPVPPYNEHEKLFTPESWRKLSRALEQTARNGIPYELELEMAVSGKKIGWMWAYGEAIKNEQGEIYALWGVAQDITERENRNIELQKAKKEADSANLLKNNFLANMSHEIRTPMNGIIGFANLLKGKNLTNQQRDKYLNIIDGNSQQLLNLIDDIINVARIESNNLKVTYENCSISKLFTSLELNFKQILKNKGKSNVHIKSEIPEKYKDLVLVTDSNRLHQVLVNLIGNAIKFTDSGVISYGFKIKKSFVEFYVKDEGIGIPDDKITEIFERFRQVNYNKNAKYGGTGLGLAISKGIIDLLGGGISVKSQLGKGSEFMFTIPLKIAKTAKKQIKEAAPKDNLLSNKTILIAEDEETIQFFFEEVFRETKAKIIMAKDGAEAVSLYKEHPEIDLVLMDLRMPNLNGFEATKEIIEINPEVIIIAQTSYAMTAEKEKCLEKGFKDYLTKPIEMEKLLEKVQEWI